MSFKYELEGEDENGKTVICHLQSDNTYKRFNEGSLIMERSFIMENSERILEFYFDDEATMQTWIREHIKKLTPIDIKAHVKI